MANISKLKPGQIVWNIRRHKMGNTTVRTLSVYEIRVISVGEFSVLASWNGNPAKHYTQRDIEKWKLKQPVTIPTWNGYGARLATREEIKAMKEKGKLSA